ncbi:FCD domain-containing protein [Puniceicoccaceae bacterium K14]|nr:FCD domain-containing protein [Puniceicoccaceae bacterium K14]
MVLKEPELLIGVERVLDPSILSDDTMQDVFELRLVLEVGMGDLIFSRLKKEDIDELAEIAERENNDPGCADLETRLKYEIEFHSKLYQMSGNKTLTKFQTILLPVFNYMMKQETKNDVKPRPGKITHDALVETLRTGTPAKFRVNMREHLSPHYKSL